MGADHIPAVPIGSRPRRIAVVARLALVVLAAVGSLALGVPWAHAHAELTLSNPAENAVLASPPTTLRLTFNEDLMPRFATLTVTMAGATPKKLRAKVEGRTMTASAPTGARAGRWVTAYRIVSVDGHVMTGSIRFTVRSATAGKSTAVPSPSLPTTGTPPAVPPAATGREVLLGAPAAGTGTASSASEGFGTAPSGLGWWVASGVCLVSSAVLAKLGRKRS